MQNKLANVSFLNFHSILVMSPTRKRQKRSGREGKHWRFECRKIHGQHQVQSKQGIIVV